MVETPAQSRLVPGCCRRGHTTLEVKVFSSDYTCDVFYDSNKTTLFINTLIFIFQNNYIVTVTLVTKMHNHSSQNAHRLRENMANGYYNTQQMMCFACLQK